jgi:hypothetical protein
MGPYEHDFEKVTDFDSHWLINDCIKSVKRDIYFSISTRYFCDAGCHVCYIKDNLKKIKSNLNNYYFDFTDNHEELWEQVFNYFDYHRTDDDMMFLKLNYPKHYDWFKRNGHRFEYGMTDNAIFRFQTVRKELQFKGVASITLSSYFLNKINQQKLDLALEKIHIDSPIKQIKLVNTGDLESLKKYADWANDRNIEVLFHYDFLTQRELNSEEWAKNQVTWIDNDDTGNMQIYGDEAICLFYDRFFFNSDVSSDDRYTSYHHLTEKFDHKQFLVDMARGKQSLYEMWISRTKNERFKNYFETCQHYQFHNDYNFIPGPMMPPWSKYCKEMEKEGWIRMKHGFYKPGEDTIKPFVTKK